MTPVRRVSTVERPWTTTRSPGFACTSLFGFMASSSLADLTARRLPPRGAPRIGESAEPGSANYGRVVLSRARIGALPDAAAGLCGDPVAMDNVATRARGEEPTMSATIDADAHVSEAN